MNPTTSSADDIGTMRHTGFMGPNLIRRRMDQLAKQKAEEQRLKEEKEQSDAARARLAQLSELLLAQPVRDLDAQRSYMHDLNQNLISSSPTSWSKLLSSMIGNTAQRAE